MKSIEIGVGSDILIPNREVGGWGKTYNWSILLLQRKGEVSGLTLRTCLSRETKKKKNHLQIYITCSRNIVLSFRSYLCRKRSNTSGLLLGHQPKSFTHKWAIFKDVGVSCNSTKGGWRRPSLSGGGRNRCRLFSGLRRDVFVACFRQEMLGRSGISGEGNGLRDYYVAKTLASTNFHKNGKTNGHGQKSIPNLSWQRIQWVSFLLQW